MHHTLIAKLAGLLTRIKRPDQLSLPASLPSKKQNDGPKSVTVKEIMTPLGITISNVLLAKSMTKTKILLIGDNCIDRYTYGRVPRLSPEAPVPVFQPVRSIELAGMAGNVKRNLERLGLEVDFQYTSVSHKERLLDEHSNYHLLRIDNDANAQPIAVGFISKENLSNYSAIVISDYNKGTVTYELVKWLRSVFFGPIFVDTKKHDLAQFNNCYVKVNEHERAAATSVPDPTCLITTLGKAGAEYKGTIFPSNLIDVVDVCGAGDTFLAALTYDYLSTRSITSAIKFANRAASITVQHVGVYAPSLEEISTNAPIL